MPGSPSKRLLMTPGTCARLRICTVAPVSARNWGQLQRDLKSGPAESIDRLLDPPDEDALFQQVSDAMLHAAGGSREADTFSSSGASRRGAEWWLYRMAYGGDPLGEKLTLFWHNHFATALRGVYSMPLMLRQNATLRKHARGSFGELLSAIEADPAMLLWLDGGSNQKDHPNENFARELLELFTLGTGNYTENDVREAARGLTGWQAGRNNLLQRTNDLTYRDDLADVAPRRFWVETARGEHPIFCGSSSIILPRPSICAGGCIAGLSTKHPSPTTSSFSHWRPSIAPVIIPRNMSLASCCDRDASIRRRPIEDEQNRRSNTASA